MTRRSFTKAELEASATPKGGFTAKQIRAWGLSYPPKTGWLKKLLRDGVPAACPYPAGFDPSAHPVEPKLPNPLMAMAPSPAAIEMGDDALEVFTDGSCDPNPGPGGWGFAVFRRAAEVHSASGGDPATTNNRMELLGLIQALRWLDPAQQAIVWTDSQYAQNGCTAWRHGWKRKNWTRGKAALANADLWQQLDALLDARVVDVRWTKAHVGTTGNERADELAEEGRQSVLGDAGARVAPRTGRSSAEIKPLAQQAVSSQVDKLVGDAESGCLQTWATGKTGRAGSRGRGKPVVDSVERRKGPVLHQVQDDAGPVLIKRADAIVAALVRGGAD